MKRSDAYRLLAARYLQLAEELEKDAHLNYELPPPISSFLDQADAHVRDGLQSLRAPGTSA